jgi:Domain of unknown function (DUF1330)
MLLRETYRRVARSSLSSRTGGLPLDWYNSDEYTAIRKLRERAARASLYVVDGLDDSE